MSSSSFRPARRRRRRATRAAGLGAAVLALGWTLATAAVHADWLYTVRPGDTLYLLSQRFGVDLNALRQANQLWTDAIYPGDVLTIPSDGEGGGGSGGPGGRGWPYTVRSGDTLFLIAQRFGVALIDLRRLNNLWSDWIYPGMRILIPAAAPEEGPLWQAPPGVNQSEYDLLARLVHAEAAGEPFEGQVAVAAVVLNRVDDPRYPGSIAGVINQVSDGYYQFSPVLDGRIREPADETAYRAARAALSGWDPSRGATGFYNPAKTDNAWVRQHPVTAVIGRHVFFRY
ncbi:MAG TPA: LysM peptidoglycan-binding domain-containing protein [Limnochordia bacterium]